MRLVHRGNSHVFRSKGLFVFLRILQEAHPCWVDLASLQTRLPGAGPRQLARFVDSLEEAGLELVSFETKTRGRYRLAVPPEELSMDGEMEPSLANAHLPSRPTEPLDVFLEPTWVAWVVALLHATLAVHEGSLIGDEGAMGHLATAETSTERLPKWTASVVYVCRAYVLERVSRYREAASWLRRVDTAMRQGQAHPMAGAQAQLVRAKMRYDQARYAEAERLVELLPEQGNIHCPHRLNMEALLAGRKFLNAGDAEAPAFLAQALSSLATALGDVFLWQADSSLLDALCYNFGNNLLRGIQRGVLPGSCGDTAMQWLAANQLACRKLGIGDDSILINLSLLDAGLEHGYGIERWPPLLQQGLNAYKNLDDLLSASLTQARKNGHRLEIAHCLMRQMRITTSLSEAQEAYQEATALFGELGHRDDLATLLEEWRNRFENTQLPDSSKGCS